MSMDDLLLEVLDLEEPTTPEEITARYRVLTKELHPDITGGDPDKTQRLRSVIRAYRTLQGRGRVAAE